MCIYKVCVYILLTMEKGYLLVKLIELLTCFTQRFLKLVCDVVMYSCVSDYFQEHYSMLCIQLNVMHENFLNLLMIPIF